MLSHSQNETTRQYSNANSDRLSTHKLKRSHVEPEILCRITFDLDEKSQELLVYEDTSLNQLTDNLVEKLKLSCLANGETQYQITEDDKAYLKEEIKARIQQTMDQNIEKSLQSAKWRNKLRQIIEEKVRTPMDSLVSPSSQRQTPTQSKSVSYFKYNFPQGETDQTDKQRQMIERMKTLDKEINKQAKSKDNKKNRLYDLGKQTNLLKDYLSKIHEYETKQEELSQCTFHPFVKKHHQAKQYSRLDHQGSQNVFKRLYNEAIQKKEKMKKIEVEVQNRQTEEYKHLNFIPQINECSKEIIRAKKDQKTSIYETLYNDVLQKEKKKFEPEWTFHPTICAKSNEIVKKNEQSKKNQKQLALSKNFFKDQTKRNKNQSVLQAQRHGMKTQHSLQKSPISRKNMSTKKLGGYKMGRASQAYLKQMRNEEETLKKISYRPNIHYESEQTLKENIFSKRAFKKPNKAKNIMKQNCLQIKPQINGSYFVDSKNIKRQKVIIADQTLETCNTEETSPLYTVNEHLSNMMDEYQPEDRKNRANKDKNSRLDPFLFFQQKEREKQKQKKTNANISNKQNFDSSKQKLQEHAFQQQFQRRKNSIFQEIFDFLLRESKGQDELYSDAIIDSSLIPSSLKHIFHPMAEEMKQLNVGLDKQQFVWSMTRIFDSLTLQQRGWILAWGLKLQEPKNETVKNLR